MIDGLVAGKLYGKPATRSGASGKRGDFYEEWKTC